MISQKSWMRAFLQMVLVHFHLVRHTKIFSAKAARAANADTHPGWFWIPDFWCLFGIYVWDKNWHSVRRPRCAHTEIPNSPWEVKCFTLVLSGENRRWDTLSAFIYIFISNRNISFANVSVEIFQSTTQKSYRIFHARGLRATGARREIQKGDISQEQVHVSL